MTLPLDEAQRLEALRRYEILDTVAEQAFDDLTMLAAKLCEAPIALISLVDENRQWFKARVGLGVAETPRAISFCTEAIAQNDLFIVSDLESDARFSTSPFVTGEASIRFYAGMPLVTPEGSTVGTLCVLDRVPRELRPEQQAALRILGRQVMAQLELRRRTHELKRASAERDRQYEELESIYKSAPVGLALVDRDLRHVRINDRLAALNGRPAAEHIGRTIHEMAPTIAPQIEAFYRQVFTTGQPLLNIEIHQVATATSPATESLGQYYPVKSTDGSVRAIAVVVMDITEHKRVQEERRQVFERITDAFVALDDSWRCSYVNAKAAQILGKPSADLVGKYFWSEYPESHRLQFQLTCEKAMAGQRPVFVEEHYPADDRWFENRIYPSPQGLTIYFHDITERKRNEALLNGQKEVLEMIGRGAPLRETLDRLLAMVESQSPEMICTLLLLDPEGKYLRHGASASVPEEYSRAIDNTPIGPSCGTCGTAAFRREQVVVEDIATDPLWAEYRHLALPHGLRACWSTPIFDPAQRVLGTFAVYFRQPGRPTERHQQLIDGATHIASIAINRDRLEADARLLAQRLTLATDAAAIGIWDWDIKNDLWFATPTYSTMLGYDPEQSAGWWERWSERIHPDDRSAVEEKISAARNGSDTPYSYEVRIRHADGAYRWISVIGRVLAKDENGKASRMIGVRIDITARVEAREALRETAERFRQVVENIQEVFWMIDPLTDELLYISPAFEKIWGRSCESLYAAPQTWFDAIHPEDRDRVGKASDAGRKGGNYNETYRIVRPDGTERWIHDHAYPISDGAGQIFRVVGTAEDVTEQHQTAEANARLEIQVRQGQKMEAIGTLAGGIAHDFNNILGVINGYADLAKMSGPAPELVEYLDAISDAGARATKLVRQILTFSRQGESEREVIQLGPVVNEALRFLRATIPSTIEFEVVLGGAIPAVLADPTQVHQIIMNLGSNASHAMKERGGRLTVLLKDIGTTIGELEPELNLPPRHYVQLSISDTGKGMDAATLRRIFEPFFTTKSPGEGTGLGLAAVHGIMLSHEGGVTATSNPGEGSCFNLYFPTSATVAADRVATPTAPEAGDGEYILVVDDEESLLMTAKKVLERLGYRADAHIVPEEALLAVRLCPEKYDLVITDLTMPGLTGTELAEEIRRIRPDLPIILTTGYSDTLRHEDLHAIGVREMLLKPLTIQELGDAVHRILKNSKTR